MVLFLDRVRRGGVGGRVVEQFSMVRVNRLCKVAPVSGSNSPRTHHIPVT